VSFNKHNVYHPIGIINRYQLQTDSMKRTLSSTPKEHPTSGFNAAHKLQPGYETLLSPAVNAAMFIVIRGCDPRMGGGTPMEFSHCQCSQSESSGNRRLRVQCSRLTNSLKRTVSLNNGSLMKSRILKVNTSHIRVAIFQLPRSVINLFLCT
jgi:hypothetical protein